MLGDLENKRNIEPKRVLRSLLPSRFNAPQGHK